MFCFNILNYTTHCGQYITLIVFTTTIGKSFGCNRIYFLVKLLLIFLFTSIPLRHLQRHSPSPHSFCPSKWSVYTIAFIVYQGAPCYEVIPSSPTPHFCCVPSFASKVDIFCSVMQVDSPRRIGVLELSWPGDLNSFLLSIYISVCIITSCFTHKGLGLIVK